MVLIGYRGSGKSTVGRLLAERLGRPMVDTDVWIVQRAGKSIREIFEVGGEKAFRDLETAAILHVAPFGHKIIAVGGGALGREENLAAIQAGGHAVVYLRCEAGELLRRIQADPATATARPALSKLGGGIEEIQTILAEREPLWRRVRKHEVDVTALSPEQAAEAISRLIETD